MATLIKPNGESTIVYPINKTFKLEELYKLVECETVEVVILADGRDMYIDEDGKYSKKPVNTKATELLHEAGGMAHDYILGNALVTRKKEVK